MSWETVYAAEDASTLVDRLEVPGGWLYKVITMTQIDKPNCEPGDWIVLQSVEFVPDPGSVRGHAPVPPGGRLQ